MAEGRRPAGRARQRLLQACFAAAGALAVAVAGATADALLAIEDGATARAASAALVIGGHVAGGWALGMALRLQFARAVDVDRGARVLLGIPACLLATWPLTAGSLPPVLVARLPAWFASGAAADLAPFAGVALGLVLALGVTPSRRRS